MSIAQVFAVNTYSQNTRLSLNLKNVSAKTVLSQIEDKTEFYFIYDATVVDVEKNVSINSENQLVTEILDQIFQGDNIIYKIKDRQIALSTNTINVGNQQQKSVSGKVADSSGAPMPGATVLVKGTTTGTITDANGNYSISNLPANATLVFSFMGMKTQEVLVGNNNQIKVILEQETIGLDEVVAIGYGTMKKSDLTGSVTNISDARLLDNPAFNVAQAIGGKLAGVKVIERSGTPGGAPMIRIRGTNSINSSNEPLFVVDGIVGVTNAMTTLNPNEIESIDVLKDASATAIYGARGSNGVIIITTKRGIAGETQIEYNGYTTLGTLSRHNYALTADQFMYVYEQAWANIQKYSTNPDRSKDFRGPTAAGRSYSEMPWLFKKVNQGDYFLSLMGKDGNYYAPRFDTNWESEALRNPNSMNHQINVRGGNEKAKYGLFLGYTDEQGLLNGSYSKRYSGKLNSDIKVFKWFDISANFTFQEGKESIKEEGDNIRMMIEGYPILPVKYPDDPAIYGSLSGKYSDASDFPSGEVNRPAPVGALVNGENFNNLDQIRGDITLNFKITKDLSFKSNFGIDNFFKKNKRYSGKKFGGNGSASVNTNQTFYWQNENYFNYVKQFGSHKITGLLGFSWSKYRWENADMSNSYFFDDFYKWHNIGMGTATRPNVSSSDGFNSLNSYFARGNYSYKNKYLLTVTSRVDGSSKFGANSKYGLFPSGSLAWRLSEEDFVKDIAVISNLKLRMSAGQTGNQEIGSYVTQTFLGSDSKIVFGNDAVSGLFQSSVGNPDLKWEKTTQYDGGVDLGLFKDRITMAIDYYYKKTTDMLLDVPLPQSTTTGSVKKNYGTIENKGFELTIGTHNIKSKDINWYTDVAFTSNKNKIVKLGMTGADIFRNGWVGGANTVLRVGQPIGSYWGLNRLGTYSTQEASLAARYGLVAGDVKYEDKNNDGKIDYISDGGIIGTAFPKWEMNITNNLMYKSFDINLDIRMVIGLSKEDRINHSGEDRQLVSSGKNSILDAWRPDHQNTMIGQVRPGMGGAYYQTFPDTHWIQDASFIRGEGATLGYTLPRPLVDKLGINKLRVYLNTKNFFLLTKYNGYDPEGSDIGNMDSLTPGMDFYMYPRPTTYTFGVNIIF